MSLAFLLQSTQSVERRLVELWKTTGFIWQTKLSEWAAEEKKIATTLDNDDMDKLRRGVSWLFGALSPVNQENYIRARETCIKRYLVERTNKAEIRPEEQREKAESCRENLWNEMT